MKKFLVLISLVSWNAWSTCRTFVNIAHDSDGYNLRGEVTSLSESDCKNKWDDYFITALSRAEEKVYKMVSNKKLYTNCTDVRNFTVEKISTFSTGLFCSAYKANDGAILYKVSVDPTWKIKYDCCDSCPTSP